MRFLILVSLFIFVFSCDPISCGHLTSKCGLNENCEVSEQYVDKSLIVDENIGYDNNIELNGDRDASSTEPVSDRSMFEIYKELERERNKNIEIFSISPKNCCVDYTLNIIITGKKFDNNSKIYFDSKPLDTYYESPTQIRGRITFPSKTGVYKVWVEDLDGNKSNNKDFDVILCRDTSIAYLQPSRAKSGENVLLKVFGYSFQSNHKIYFEDDELGTKYLSPKQLEVAPYLSLKIIKEGKYKVKIKTDKEICGSYFTGSRTFTVTSASINPEIQRVLPNTLSIGNKYSMKVYGQRFQPECKIYVNSIKFDCKFIYSTLLSFDFDVDNTWKKGEYDLFIENKSLEKSNIFKIKIE